MHVPVTRSSYLIEFTNLMRRTGAPVERELARARLPTCLEETPDAYLSLNLVVDFLMRTARQEGMDDLGFEAGWQTRFDNFSPQMLAVLRAAPTINTRIEQFIHCVHLEDNTIRASMQDEGDQLRVAISGDYPDALDLRITEWQQLKALIEVVRAGGDAWLPSEMTFCSDFTLSSTARKQLGGTRIRTGQALTSILFSHSDLVPPGMPGVAAQAVCHRNPVEVLRRAMEPYLASDGLSLDLAAEISGCSVRSLQRHLSLQNTSYSGLLEQVRFEMATRLLADSSVKVIDIALSLGYRDASNFSRAFRRLSGLSPKQYRQYQLAQAYVARNDLNCFHYPVILAKDVCHTGA